MSATYLYQIHMQTTSLRGAYYFIYVIHTFLKGLHSWVLNPEIVNCGLSPIIGHIFVQIFFLLFFINFKLFET